MYLLFYISLVWVKDNGFNRSDFSDRQFVFTSRKTGLQGSTSMCNMHVRLSLFLSVLLSCHPFCFMSLLSLHNKRRKKTLAYYLLLLHDLGFTNAIANIYGSTDYSSNMNSRMFSHWWKNQAWKVHYFTILF